MSKPHKIKKYSQKTQFFPSRRGRLKPLKVIISVVIVAALVFLGLTLYAPVKNFFTGSVKSNPLPPAPLEPKPTAPVAEIVSPPEAIIEPDTPPITANIRGVAIPLSTLQNSSQLDSLLASLHSSINTVVITGKDSDGKLYFSTSNQLANDWHAVSGDAVDLRELSDKLEARGLNLAVRLSVFSDPIAARGDFEQNAIMHNSGVIWLDNSLDKGGKPWVTPYSDSVREYNLQLITEAVSLGADLIILDYMRFPSDQTKSALVGEKDSVSREAILNQFYSEAKTAAGGTPLLVSISRWTVEQQGGDRNPTLFGGDPMLLDATDWLVEMDDTMTTGQSLSDSGLTVPESKRFIPLIEGEPSAVLTDLAGEEFILN